MYSQSVRRPCGTGGPVSHHCHGPLRSRHFFRDFLDDIRKLLAAESRVDAALFSFNSKGACPACKGKGMVVTELVFMDPVTTVCEVCEGSRYSDEALSYRFRGKNILDILNMTAEEAAEFFWDNKKLP